MKINVLLLTSLFFSFSLHSQLNRVVGGEFTTVNEFEWMVDLSGCGGSLITSEWVITAGHCAESGAPANVGNTLTINSYSRSNNQPGTETRTISEVHIFPGFSTLNNFYRPDLALVKLSSPSSFPTVPMISDLADTVLTQAGDSCTVLGWGSIDMNATQSDTLKKGNIIFRSKSFCRTQYSGAFSVIYDEDTSHCAGYITGSAQTGAGSGDSGGPLFVMKGGNPLLVGIVSAGREVITTDIYPGIYTNILPLKSWINWKISPTSGLTNEVISQFITLYNSPEGITIDSKIEINEPMQLSVYDATGKLLNSETITINKGKTSKSFNTMKSSGLYVITLRGSNSFLSHKVVVLN